MTKQPNSSEINAIGQAETGTTSRLDDAWARIEQDIDLMLSVALDGPATVGQAYGFGATIGYLSVWLCVWIAAMLRLSPPSFAGHFLVFIIPLLIMGYLHP